MFSIGYKFVVRPWFIMMSPLFFKAIKTFCTTNHLFKNEACFQRTLGDNGPLIGHGHVV